MHLQEILIYKKLISRTQSPILLIEMTLNQQVIRRMMNTSKDSIRMGGGWCIWSKLMRLHYKMCLFLFKLTITACWILSFGIPCSADVSRGLFCSQLFLFKLRYLCRKVWQGCAVVVLVKWANLEISSYFTNFTLDKECRYCLCNLFFYSRN